MKMVEQDKPKKPRSLASKFSVFTGGLLLWVVMVTLYWDILQHTFTKGKAVVLCGLVGFIARRMCNPRVG